MAYPHDMNRDALKLLLSTGKSLCYKPNAFLRGRGESQAESTGDPGALSTTGTAGLPATAEATETGTAVQILERPRRTVLFDSEVLQNAVFFKEAGLDATGAICGQTRVMLTFDDDNLIKGGASTSADPETLATNLRKWYGRGFDFHLSMHDRNILSVLCRAPTFDPFIMLSYREEMEYERKVAQRYFDVDEALTKKVKAIIKQRATRLVRLSLEEGVADTTDDDDVFEIGGMGKDEARLGAPADPTAPAASTPANAAKVAHIQVMTTALIDAIWTCELDGQARALLKGFRIEEAEMEKVLFAWKGISYYEYLFNTLLRDNNNFLKWLGSDHSLPRDREMMDAFELEDVRNLRRTGINLVRNAYLETGRVLSEYDAAYAALTDRKDPKPFQKFLNAAPEQFQTLGYNIGKFAHAGSAWVTLTNHGNRPKLPGEKLLPFYEFLVSLGSSKPD